MAKKVSLIPVRGTPNEVMSVLGFPEAFIEIYAEDLADEEYASAVAADIGRACGIALGDESLAELQQALTGIDAENRIINPEVSRAYTQGNWTGRVIAENAVRFHVGNIADSLDFEVAEKIRAATTCVGFYYRNDHGVLCGLSIAATPQKTDLSDYQWAISHISDVTAAPNDRLATAFIDESLLMAVQPTKTRVTPWAYSAFELQQALRDCVKSKKVMTLLAPIFAGKPSPAAVGLLDERLHGGKNIDYRDERQALLNDLLKLLPAKEAGAIQTQATADVNFFETKAFCHFLSEQSRRESLRQSSREAFHLAEYQAATMGMSDKSLGRMYTPAKLAKAVSHMDSGEGQSLGFAAQYRYDAFNAFVSKLPIESTATISMDYLDVRFKAQYLHQQQLQAERFYENNNLAQSSFRRYVKPLMFSVAVVVAVILAVVLAPVDPLIMAACAVIALMVTGIRCIFAIQKEQQQYHYLQEQHRQLQEKLNEAADNYDEAASESHRLEATALRALGGAGGNLGEVSDEEEQPGAAPDEEEQPGAQSDEEEQPGAVQPGSSH